MDVSKKVDDFFAQYNLHSFAKGHVLILNDEPINYIYYLLEGQVKVYDVTYRGEEIILNVFKPPAFFPMSHAINQVPNSYIYEAETNVVFRQAPAAEVVAFIKENPDVMFDLLSRLYRGVDGLMGRTAQLMASSAHSRLLYELVLETRRSGQQQADNSYLLPINERALGARAGLSRETVSRELRKLKDEGLVAVEAKHLRIKGLELLEKKLTNNNM